jgi:hypothetical protein
MMTACQIKKLSVFQFHAFPIRGHPSGERPRISSGTSTAALGKVTIRCLTSEEQKARADGRSASEEQDRDCEAGPVATADGLNQALLHHGTSSKL